MFVSTYIMFVSTFVRTLKLLGMDIAINSFKFPTISDRI